MKRRLAAVAGIVAFMLAVLTSPASAARPSDPAQGCENTKADPLDGYCAENP